LSKNSNTRKTFENTICKVSSSVQSNLNKHHLCILVTLIPSETVLYKKQSFIYLAWKYSNQNRTAVKSSSHEFLGSNTNGWFFIIPLHENRSPYAAISVRIQFSQTELFIFLPILNSQGLFLLHTVFEKPWKLPKSVIII